MNLSVNQTHEVRFPSGIPPAQEFQYAVILHQASCSPQLEIVLSDISDMFLANKPSPYFSYLEFVVNTLDTIPEVRFFLCYSFPGKIGKLDSSCLTASLARASLSSASC